MTQQLGAEATGLGAAEAAVVQANARLADVEQQNVRAETLFKRGVSARAAVDTARANLAVAQSSLRAAEAQLAQSRERLGPQGEDNPQIQTALAQREKAQIDLMHARVTAPVDGVVTNTVLSVGQFVGSGQHVATIIDTASVWIVAQIPENALGRIKTGRPGGYRAGRGAGSGLSGQGRKHGVRCRAGRLRRDCRAICHHR